MPQNQLFRKVYWWLLRTVVSTIFRLIWPLLARIPMRPGMTLADCVGFVCHALDIDWRTVALRTHFVRYRTHFALSSICGRTNQRIIESRLRGRFINAAREELEGHWFPLHRADECRCEFEGLNAIREHTERGQGVVFLTLHFDATLMGVVKMGQAGIKLNLMTSDIVEDARVPASVQRYFKRKYAGITHYLRGGRTLHVETQLRAFYTGLRRGESVVVLGEAPSDKPDEALIVSFLGGLRAMAPGAVRIAERAGAPMAAFVCLRLGVGHYRIIFSPLYFPSPEDAHARNAPQMYSFLENHIRSHPERWWASDLMYNYTDLDQR